MQTTIISHPCGYIYALTNKVNNKCYIGQVLTHRLPTRWNSYKKLHCKLQPKIYAALKKYGPDNFFYELLDIGHNSDELDILETQYIRMFNSMHNGYNCNEGGISRGAFKCSDETRKKISESNKGRIVTQETKQKISESQCGEKSHMYGKCGVLNPAYGISHSKESIEKRKQTLLLSNYHPKPFSEETKIKMSLAHHGKRMSPESRLKMSLAKRGVLKGRKLSEETKRKISEKRKGFKFTEESKLKMSKSHMSKTNMLD